MANEKAAILYQQRENMQELPKVVKEMETSIRKAYALFFHEKLLSKQDLVTIASAPSKLNLAMQRFNNAAKSTEASNPIKGISVEPLEDEYQPKQLGLLFDSSFTVSIDLSGQLESDLQRISSLVDNAALKQVPLVFDLKVLAAHQIAYVRSLDILVVKRSHLEGLHDILEWLSPARPDGRPTACAPFAWQTSKVGKEKAAAGKNKEAEGEKLLEAKPISKAEKVGDSLSLQSAARQKVDEDFVSYEWLQEFGAPVCRRSVESFIADLAAAIRNKQAIGKPQSPAQQLEFMKLHKTILSSKPGSRASANSEGEKKGFEVLSAETISYEESLKYMAIPEQLADLKAKAKERRLSAGGDQSAHLVG